MKNLYLMLAASLFLFGCGTNYWAGNSSEVEVEIDGVKIAAGFCEEIKVRGDFEWKVNDIAKTEEGDWLWNGADWSKLTEDQIKSCEENGKLEGAAGDPPADPNKQQQAGAKGSVTTDTQEGFGALAGCTETNNNINCVKDSGAKASARLVVYTTSAAGGTCNKNDKSNFHVYAPETNLPDTVCQDKSVAECTKAKDDWVKKQVAAGYNCG